jgi:hypothetical protein
VVVPPCCSCLRRSLQESVISSQPQTPHIATMVIGRVCTYVLSSCTSTMHLSLTRLDEIVRGSRPVSRHNWVSAVVFVEDYEGECRCFEDLFELTKFHALMKRYERVKERRHNSDIPWDERWRSSLRHYMQVPHLRNGEEGFVRRTLHIVTLLW